jgi:hypothetical protein
LLLGAAPALAQDEPRRPTWREWTGKKEEPEQPEKPEDREESDTAAYASDSVRLGRKMMFVSRSDSTRGWITSGIGTGLGAYTTTLFWMAAVEPRSADEQSNYGLNAAVTTLLGGATHISSSALFAVGGISGDLGSGSARDAIVALGGRPLGTGMRTSGRTFLWAGLGASLVATGLLFTGPDQPKDFRPIAAIQTASFASMLLGSILLNVDLVQNRARLQELLEAGGEESTTAAVSPKMDATVTVMNSDRALGLAVVGAW